MQLQTFKIQVVDMAEKYPSNNEKKDEKKESDLGDELVESFGSNSSSSDRLTSSSDSNSMPKRQREESPSKSPVRPESPSASYRMVPRKFPSVC